MGGCVSSALLMNQQQQQKDFMSRQMEGRNSSSLGHHIVCLTSSTYGLLSLDPPNSSDEDDDEKPPAPPEIINSWELMAGLDHLIITNNKESSFRGFPRPKKPLVEEGEDDDDDDKENSNPNNNNNNNNNNNGVLERYCRKVIGGGPKGGEEKVVVYTTSLGTVRKTLEECKAVKAVLEGMGVAFCERDISMDIGWRQELTDLLLLSTSFNNNNNNSNNNKTPTPPRVFVKGMYLGGTQEFMTLAEQGILPLLLQGFPTPPASSCHGCGGLRFLPCLSCNGSCKILRIQEQPSIMDLKQQQHNTTTTTTGSRRPTSTTTLQVVPCPHCNENGLMLCPICN
ncbi:uncharacterized protein At5g39865-like [Impatiens glandulifera]|uniref:uncharacterized protein At5g39865-like n=1 Tax=Impatiens glandulifera TaxID=253017 RepID=UPI001FB074C1|nr:uncharacterized protein At5g39865-like [Impatiens glandulifera]